MCSGKALLSKFLPLPIFAASETFAAGFFKLTAL
jgi:hypothetical protein